GPVRVRGGVEMTRIRRKAREIRVKVGLGALFLAGLFVSGAFGEVSPITLTGSSSTDTIPASSSFASTDTTSAPTTSATLPTSSAATTTTAAPSSTVPYIVTFAEGTSGADQLSEIQAAGGTAGDPIPVLSMYSITLPSGEDAADVVALKANANVIAVEQDH